MKSLRKSILTLLALTLFGGAGAWAQGIHVTFFDVPDSWNGDNTYITAADLEGFQSITADEAQAGASIQSEGVVYLFYAIDGQNVSMMAFASGTYGGGTTEPVTRNAFYVAQNNGAEIYYSSVIKLTKVGANQWTLGQTPDYDLELQVEYYEAHALKNIPAGWQVMVNGVDKTAAIEGDSLNITETDSVTLIPANPHRVKSVTLSDDAPVVQTITIGGINLQIAEGDTWAQIIDRNPGVLEIGGSYVNTTTGYFLMTSSPVSTTSTYDPSLNYWWQEW